MILNNFNYTNFINFLKPKFLKQPNVFRSLLFVHGIYFTGKWQQYCITSFYYYANLFSQATFVSSKPV